jgi:hypothetical protein
MNIWTNEKFIAALVTLLVVIVAQFVPGFKMDEQQLVQAVLVIGMYAVGTLKDPGAPGLVGALKSRKFWAAVVGVAANFLTAFNVQLPDGLTYDLITELVTGISGALIMSFAFTQPVAPALPEE